MNNGGDDMRLGYVTNSMTPREEYSDSERELQ